MIVALGTPIAHPLVSNALSVPTLELVLAAFVHFYKIGDKKQKDQCWPCTWEEVGSLGKANPRLRFS